MIPIGEASEFKHGLHMLQQSVIVPGRVILAICLFHTQDVWGLKFRAGIKAEKEGLKASEKSDHAVRDAADKLIHNSDKAGNKADQKSGGFFSGIGNWFRDRYLILPL